MWSLVNKQIVDFWGGSSNFPNMGKWHLAFGKQSNTLWRESRCNVKTYVLFCLFLTSCIKAGPGSFVSLSVFRQSAWNRHCEKSGLSSECWELAYNVKGACMKAYHQPVHLPPKPSKSLSPSSRYGISRCALPLEKWPKLPTVGLGAQGVNIGHYIGWG